MDSKTTKKVNLCKDHLSLKLIALSIGKIALDESFSSRNHVRKFLRALPTKWRPKVTAIEESKNLSTLLLDELIGNLKVYEVVLRRTRSDDEKYAMANFRRAKEEKKGKEKQRCFKYGDPNHFISDCPQHSFNDQKSFIGGCWSDSEEEDDSKKDEICLVAHDTVGIKSLLDVV
ncbi:zf-CCHC domain-containing protein [Tanacetum coccineum]